MLTTYLRSIEVNDGYNGRRTWLHLCVDRAGVVYAVHRYGHFRWIGSAHA